MRSSIGALLFTTVIAVGNLAAQDCVDYDAVHAADVVTVFQGDRGAIIPRRFEVSGQYMVARWTWLWTWESCGYEYYDIEGPDMADPAFTSGCGDEHSDGIGRGADTRVAYNYDRHPCGTCPNEYYAFVTDLGRPERPTAELPYHGAIWIVDDLALVRLPGYPDDELGIVGIEDLEAPLDLGTVALQGRIDPDLGGDLLDVSGHLVVVTDTWSIHVYDIADPAVPALVTSLQLPAATLDVAPGPDYLVLSCGAEGVRIVDLGDAARPAVSDAVAMPAFVHSGAVAHPYGYFSCTGLGVVAMDLGDADPVVLGGHVACDPGQLEAGADRLFLRAYADTPTHGQILRLPVHCGGSHDDGTTSLGALKALYR